MPFIASTGNAAGYGHSQLPGPVIIAPNPLIYLDATNSQVSTVGVTTSKTMSNIIAVNDTFQYQFLNSTPIYGGSISFTAGSTNYGYNPISLSAAAASNSWSETKELWIRLPDTAAGSNGSLLVEEGSTTPGGGWFDAQIGMSNGVLRLGIWNGSLASFTLSAAVTRNVWHQVVWRYNSATSAFDGFYDGTKITGITTGRQNPSAFGYPLHYFLGVGTTTNLGSAAYMTGEIGSFKYWNSNLTDAQITSNWNATRTRFGV